jgi:hypothetical protein
MIHSYGLFCLIQSLITYRTYIYINMADDITDLKTVSSLLSTIGKQWNKIVDEKLRSKNAIADIEKSLTSLQKKRESYDEKEQEAAKRLESIENKKLPRNKADREHHLTMQSIRTKELEQMRLNISNNQETKDSLEEQLNIERERYNNLNKSIGSLEIIKNTYDSIKDIISDIISLFDRYDGILNKISNSFALTRVDSRLVYENLDDIVKGTIKFGGGIEDVLDSTSKLTKQFGILGFEHMKELNTQTILFNKVFGISYDTSTKFVSTLAQISNKSVSSQKNMLAFAHYTSKAYNVPLDVLMDSVANASDSVRTIFIGNTEELIKQSAELLSMNSSLESASRSAEGLLNFQSSFQAELRASALLGQSMNLNQARRLFFQGKIVEGEKELLKQLKQVGDFDNLNYFQKKAIADAMGKSVTELQKLTSQEKTLSKIRELSPEFAKRELEFQNKLKILTGDEAEQSRVALELEERKNISIQRSTILAAQYNKIMLNLGRALEPIAEKIYNVFSSILGVVESITSKLGTIPTLTGVILTSLAGMYISFKSLTGLTSLFTKSLTSAPTKIKLIGTVASAVSGAGVGVGTGVGSVGSDIMGSKLGKSVSGAGGMMKAINPMSLIKGAGALLLFAAAFYAFGHAIQSFKGGPDPSRLIAYVGVISVFAMSMSLMAAVLSNPVVLVAFGAGVLIITLGMYAIGGALKSLGEGAQSLSGTDVGGALSSIGVGIVTLLGSVGLFTGWIKLGHVSSFIEDLGESAATHATNIDRLANSMTSLSKSLVSMAGNSSGISTLLDSLSNIKDSTITLDISTDAKNAIETFSESSHIFNSLNDTIKSLNDKIDKLKNSFESMNVNVSIDGQQVNYNLAKSETRRGTYGIV